MNVPDVNPRNVEKKKKKKKKKRNKQKIKTSITKQNTTQYLSH